MATEQIDVIRQTLRNGDRARARDILRPLLRDTPSAELWYLAYEAAESGEKQQEFLEKALELDPDYQPALQALRTLSRDESRRNDTSVRESKTYEMLWDCGYCGTQKLLGKTHRFCPHCGAAQNPEARYFPADDEKVAVEDHVYVGADKQCPACGTLNAANVEFCPKCGAPQTDAQHVVAVGTRQAGLDETLAAEDLTARQDLEADVQAFRAQASPAKTAAKGRRWLVFAILGVVLLAVVGAIAALTVTRDATVYVTGHEWERQIDIQVLAADSRKSDCDDVPASAYNIDERYEQVDTRRVQDGETCSRQQVDQGDGTFREQQVCRPNYREEPVMGYMCYYDVDVWQQSRVAVAQGDKTDAPYWADTRLRRTGECLGCEREAPGGRREAYILQLRGDGNRTYECPVSAAVWETAQVESVFTVKVGSVLGDARCDTLQPAS